MKKFLRRDERIETPRLPVKFADFLDGYLFFKLIRNYPAPTQVYRTVREGYPTLYLKVGTNLGPEVERLVWLNGKLSIPSIVSYSTLETREYLLLTEVPGLPGDDEKWSNNISGLVEKLAKEVHTIHSLPKSDCPFSASMEVLLEKAERIVRYQMLNPQDLSEGFRHRTIKNLFDEMLQLRPTDECIVFTHGDLCLPNIIIQHGGTAGFVDWGLAGLADHHRDIALLLRSIRSNLGDKWGQKFLDEYGSDVDEQKIQFYMLLDQFTMTRSV